MDKSVNTIQNLVNVNYWRIDDHKQIIDNYYQ